MLTLLCQDIHNWFDRNQPKWYGTFSISSDGTIEHDGLALKTGQYFRIIGSAFNDGVYQYPTSDAVEEVFEGAIWAMAVPPSVVALADKIQKWVDKYGGVDSASMSPYVSESFGGYSYSKGAVGGSEASGTWQSVFAPELRPWRKLP